MFVKIPGVHTQEQIDGSELTANFGCLKDGSCEVEISPSATFVYFDSVDNPELQQFQKNLKGLAHEGGVHDGDGDLKTKDDQKWVVNVLPDQENHFFKVIGEKPGFQSDSHLFIPYGTYQKLDQALIKFSNKQGTQLPQEGAYVGLKSFQEVGSQPIPVGCSAEEIALIPVLSWMLFKGSLYRGSRAQKISIPSVHEAKPNHTLPAKPEIIQVLSEEPPELPAAAKQLPVMRKIIPLPLSIPTFNKQIESYHVVDLLEHVYGDKLKTNKDMTDLLAKAMQKSQGVLSVSEAKKGYCLLEWIRDALVTYIHDKSLRGRWQSTDVLQEMHLFHLPVFFQVGVLMETALQVKELSLGQDRKILDIAGFIEWTKVNHLRDQGLIRGGQLTLARSLFEEARTKFARRYSLHPASLGELLEELGGGFPEGGIEKLQALEARLAVSPDLLHRDMVLPDSVWMRSSDYLKLLNDKPLSPDVFAERKMEILDTYLKQSGSLVQLSIEFIAKSIVGRFKTKVPTWKDLLPYMPDLQRPGASDLEKLATFQAVLDRSSSWRPIAQEIEAISSRLVEDPHGISQLHSAREVIHVLKKGMESGRLTHLDELVMYLRRSFSSKTYQSDVVPLPESLNELFAKIGFDLINPPVGGLLPALDRALRKSIDYYQLAPAIGDVVDVLQGKDMPEMISRGRAAHYVLHGFKSLFEEVPKDRALSPKMARRFVVTASLDKVHEDMDHAYWNNRMIHNGEKSRIKRNLTKLAQRITALKTMVH